MVATLGFVLYCAYLLSGIANDWAMRLIGNKVYISNITLVLLPFAWLLSGNALRGLKRPVGRWWAGFLVCLLLATPFSVWRGGSVTMLWNYIPRSYLTFFYICAFATSLRRCRTLMYVNIAGAAVLLLTCIKFGGTGNGPDDGRFVIPESLFYRNANELGLALLLGITSFLFLIYQPAMTEAHSRSGWDCDFHHLCIEDRVARLSAGGDSDVRPGLLFQQKQVENCHICRADDRLGAIDVTGCDLASAFTFRN